MSLHGDVGTQTHPLTPIWACQLLPRGLLQQYAAVLHACVVQIIDAVPKQANTTFLVLVMKRWAHLQPA